MVIVEAGSSQSGFRSGFRNSGSVGQAGHQFDQFRTKIEKFVDGLDLYGADDMELTRAITGLFSELGLKIPPGVQGWLRTFLKGAVALFGIHATYDVISMLWWRLAVLVDPWLITAANDWNVGSVASGQCTRFNEPAPPGLRRLWFHLNEIATDESKLNDYAISSPNVVAYAALSWVFGNFPTNTPQALLHTPPYKLITKANVEAFGLW